MKARIYCHQNTQKVYQLHQKAIENTNGNTTLLEQLSAFADSLFAAWKAHDPVCKGQINNWHPDYIGQPLEVIFKAKITLADARLSIAKDCGFTDWQAVENQKDTTFNIAFEKAVNTLLDGNLEDLQTQITAMPSLLTIRSVYGHRATLLHYAGSNGVEMWRQQTPYNLPEIVKYLLAAGADKKATMFVYGGEFTTLELAATSAHPYKAGVIDDLKKILA